MKTLTKEDLFFFKENGYLIVDNVFSEDELKDIKKFLRKIIFFLIKKAISDHKDKKQKLEECIGHEFSKGIQELEAISHEYILEFYNVLNVANNPYLAKLIYSPKVLDSINKILNNSRESPLFVTSGSSVFAMPNDNLYTPNKWHTDIFYSIKDSEYIQIWAPIIENATQELGALHIMPKSHKIPFQGQIKDSSRLDSNIHRYILSDSLLEKYEDKVVEMKLGQVVFFDKHLAHRGGQNKTDRARLSLVGVYHSMNNLDFRPYPFGHEKSLMTSDEYFDEVINKA
jgi:ectoine hydroxylase-related dioxygenase (phytanoyl-CoA dioxygenase family)